MATLQYNSIIEIFQSTSRAVRVCQIFQQKNGKRWVGLKDTRGVVQTCVPADMYIPIIKKRKRYWRDKERDKEEKERERERDRAR